MIVCSSLIWWCQNEYDDDHNDDDDDDHDDDDDDLVSAGQNFQFSSWNTHGLCFLNCVRCDVVYWPKSDQSSKLDSKLVERHTDDSGSDVWKIPIKQLACKPAEVSVACIWFVAQFDFTLERIRVADFSTILNGNASIHFLNSQFSILNGNDSIHFHNFPICASPMWFLSFLLFLNAIIYSTPHEWWIILSRIFVSALHIVVGITKFEILSVPGVDS